MNLRYKISLSLILTTLVPVSLMVLIVLWYVTDDAEKNAKQTIQNYVQLMSNKLSDEFYTSIREVEIYAQIAAIKSLDPTQFSPFLKQEVLRQNGRYEKLLVSDTKGHLYNTVCGNKVLAGKCSFDDTDPNALPKLLTSRRYWQETVGNNLAQVKVTHVSDPIISYSTGVSQLIIATSIFDDENRLKGMIGASIEWDRIKRMISTLSQNTFAQFNWKPKIMLISASGAYWYHWDETKLIQLKKDAKGNVLKDGNGLPISTSATIYDEAEKELHLAHNYMLQKQSGFTEFKSATTGETNYLFYNPIISSQYSIALIVAERDVNQVSYKLKSLYLVVFFLALSVFVIAAIMIAKAITDPIGRLVNQANRLKEGNYAIEKMNSGSGELKTLSDTFSQMARVILDRQNKLERSEERFELAMKGANDGLWDWHLDNNNVYYSPRWKKMLGYDDSELDSDSSTYFKLIDSSDHSDLKNEIKAVRFSNKNSFHYKIRMRHKDGHLVHILTRGVVVRNSEGVAKRFVGTHVDITDQILSEEKIKKLNEDLEKKVKERTLKLELVNRHLKEQSMLDMMLNIGNRRGLERHLNIVHTAFEDFSHSYSLLLFDVDYFKKYNDLYGHQAGDNALIMVVNALNSKLKKSEQIYRYGGEEFICVLPNTQINKAFELAKNMAKTVEDLHIKHGQSDYNVVTISVGCAEINSSDLTWEKVISRSDNALYDAKEKGRNQASIHDTSNADILNS